jgi:hypothetical protein
MFDKVKRYLSIGRIKGARWPNQLGKGKISAKISSERLALFEHEKAAIKFRLSKKARARSQIIMRMARAFNLAIVEYP